MDKITQNLFGIAAGGAGVVLLALGYFLIVKPLGELRGLEDQIDKKKAELANLNNPAKTPKVPTKEYKNRLLDDKAALEGALTKAIGVYDSKAEQFSKYFEDSSEQPSVNNFSARYNDAITKLIADYRAKFKIVVSQEEPEKAPPEVVKRTDILPDQIPEVMKEYWAAEEVFSACNALEIGGLKKIDWQRQVETASKEAHPNYREVTTTVTVEMPFSKIENFLTRLYESNRVPFILEELTFRKPPELVAPYVDMEHPVNYDDLEKVSAPDQKYDVLIPEPSVAVTLKLHALDWKIGSMKAVEEEKKVQEKEEPIKKKPPKK